MNNGVEGPPKADDARKRQQPARLARHGACLVFVLLALLLFAAPAQAQRIQNLTLLTNTVLTNRIYIWSGDTNDAVKTITLGNLMRSLASNVPTLVLTNTTTSNVSWSLSVSSFSASNTNALTLSGSVSGYGLRLSDQTGAVSGNDTNQLLSAWGGLQLVPTGKVVNAQTGVELYTRVANGVATNLTLTGGVTNTPGTTAAGVTNIDWRLGDFFAVTNPVAGSVFWLTNVFSITNGAQVVWLAVSNPIAGAYTISNATAPVRWTNGVHPTVSTNSVDLWRFVRVKSNVFGTVQTNLPAPPF